MAGLKELAGGGGKVKEQTAREKMETNIWVEYFGANRAVGQKARASGTRSRFYSSQSPECQAVWLAQGTQ